VGRHYYAHGKCACDDGPRALRNGVRRGRIDSAEGVIEFDVPQVRGLAGWTSEVRAALAGKSEELTRLAVEMYARGLSMRDIEVAFTDQAGRCVLTRSAAGAVCERLWSEYQAFAQRDLVTTFAVTRPWVESVDRSGKSGPESGLVLIKERL
jgi:putative transposase